MPLILRNVPWEKWSFLLTIRHRPLSRGSLHDRAILSSTTPGKVPDHMMDQKARENIVGRWTPCVRAPCSSYKTRKEARRGEGSFILALKYRGMWTYTSLFHHFVSNSWQFGITKDCRHSNRRLTWFCEVTWKLNSRVWAWYILHTFEFKKENVTEGLKGQHIYLKRLNCTCCTSAKRCNVVYPARLKLQHFQYEL